jgi:hypothetical protein
LEGTERMKGEVNEGRDGDGGWRERNVECEM